MTATSASTRGRLVRTVWPDKTLYAATLVAITSVLGALQGLALLALDIQFDLERIAAWLLPSASTVLWLSAAGAVLAIAGLKKQNLPLTALGALAAFLGRPLLGLGSVIAIIAGVFLLLAWREGEHAQDPASRLHPDDWPDKALAASAVLLVASVLTAGWGIALAQDRIAFEGYGLSLAVFGGMTLAVGLLGIVSALILQRQKLPWLSGVAAVLLVPSLGLYVVAPILALVGLVLILLARREGEFD